MLNLLNDVVVQLELDEVVEAHHIVNLENVFIG